jgi:hypothetical protein
LCCESYTNAGVEDTDVGQVVVGTDSSGTLTSNGPGVVVGSLEAILTRPLEGIKEGRGTIVVANKVILSIIEDNRHCGEKIRDLVAVRDLKVVLEVLVDDVVASGPGAVRNTKTLTSSGQVDVVDNVVEVVAERTLARLADIVDVDVSGVRQADRHDLVAVVEGIRVVTALDVLNTRLVLALCLGHGGVVNLVVVVEERSIRARLNQRIGPSVSDGETLQVNLRAASLVLLPDVVSNGRNVVAGIGLSSDVELSATELRELVKEVLEEDVHILGDLVLVGDVAVRVGNVGETSSAWLVNIKQVTCIHSHVQEKYC